MKLVIINDLFMKKILIWFPVAMLILSTGCKPRVPRIVLPENPSPVESLAASEIRRYIYLRNGELANIAESDKSFSKGTVIQIERMNAAGAEEFYLKTMSEGNLQKIIVSGGSDIAILYGAYELAEQLGIRFYMHGDVVPDEKIPFNLTELDMRRKPLFSVRGILPFHDFATGPDWWNENDYKAIIAQLPKMKMNFIGFHTYPYRSNIKDIIYNAEPLYGSARRRM